MKSRFWWVPLVLCVVVVIRPARAQNDADPFKPDALRWLTKAQEHDLIETAPPPPRPGSPEDQADLAASLEAQKARTPEIEAECKRDQKFSAHLFEPIYGSDLTRENSPKLYRLMENVLATTNNVNNGAKSKYKRPRPYQGHADVVHALFDVDGFSYPSGHSMASFTLATALGAVFPAKQQALLDRALQIAQSRVDAGVHYASDIKEGETLGKATGAAILASPVFRADVAEVRAELKLP